MYLHMLFPDSSPPEMEEEQTLIHGNPHLIIFTVCNQGDEFIFDGSNQEY